MGNGGGVRGKGSRMGGSAGAVGIVVVAALKRKGEGSCVRHVSKKASRQLTAQVSPEGASYQGTDACFVRPSGPRCLWAGWTSSKSKSRMACSNGRACSNLNHTVFMDLSE
jgi:hypothetical protein